MRNGHWPPQQVIDIGVVERWGKGYGRSLAISCAMTKYRLSWNMLRCGGDPKSVPFNGRPPGKPGNSNKISWSILKRVGSTVDEDSP